MSSRALLSIIPNQTDIVIFESYSGYGHISPDRLYGPTEESEQPDFVSFPPLLTVEGTGVNVPTMRKVVNPFAVAMSAICEMSASRSRCSIPFLQRAYMRLERRRIPVRCAHTHSRYPGLRR